VQRRSLGSWTATQIATSVRAGHVTPREMVEASLRAIAARNDAVGAFVVVRAEAALREADQLARRSDLSDLPLAGVPIAIKDNVDVAGEPTRVGTVATPDQPAAEDTEVVRRLRLAGAIVVGKTNVPELCCWGVTDSVFAATRNPWDPTRTSGGSSGGSAAAVASGMVPVALATDGMGSIRIPAAACGLLGIKPGLGVVPADPGASWNGMSEHGPVATTVEDARLVLAAMAGQALPVTAANGVRIAVSTRPPVAGTRVAADWRRPAAEAAGFLQAAGHTVQVADPPYQPADALTLAAGWTAGVAEDAQGLPWRGLERRTRTHIAVGRALRLGAEAHDRRREDWTQRLAGFFADHDVLVTPALAQSPPRLGNARDRPWLANVWRDANYAPFAARFNLAGVPAVVVPWGVGDDGLPRAVQIVAPRGGEALLLDLAGQLERVHPWQRVAPAYA